MRREFRVKWFYCTSDFLFIIRGNSVSMDAFLISDRIKKKKKMGIAELSNFYKIKQKC